MPEEELLQEICEFDQIPDRGSMKFTFRQGDDELEGFCIRIKTEVFAYLNECQHLPMTLDWGNNDFFTQDKKGLICQTHGAVYVPETGVCVAGPCPGKVLTKIPVKIVKGAVYRVREKTGRSNGPV
jgi:nitrite reductase/ring-hydroxylating ferredoxin subunit